MVCYHDTTQHKPHPAPLIEAANRLKIDVGDCWAVGDDSKDIIVARAAGMYAVAARWGSPDKESLKRAFNQGYMLMRGMDKVGAEISLTVLVYNIKRVINIVGLDRLIEAVEARNKASSVKEGKCYGSRTMDYLSTIKQVYVITSHTV